MNATSAEAAQQGRSGYLLSNFWELGAWDSRGKANAFVCIDDIGATFVATPARARDQLVLCAAETLWFVISEMKREWGLRAS